MFRPASLLPTLLLLLAPFASAQQTPAVIYESMLDCYFDEESGLMSFTELDFAFAPEEPLNAAVAVVNSDNTVVKSFEFFPDYRWREGVFARAKVKGPADVTLTTPGVYNIVFLVDGKPVSRLPVVLEQTSAGDDPFDPEKTYRFYGLWKVCGHLTMQNSGDEQYPRLTFWVGARDLPEGKTKDGFSVTLKRDGEVIGHSKRTLGHISNEHYRRVTSDLFEPHTERQTPNAQILMLDEWSKDGDYEIVVTRKSDGGVIRSFTYTARGGKILPLPNSALDYEPRIDYVVPKVTKKGSNKYEFVDAIWLKGDATAGN